MFFKKRRNVIEIRRKLNREKIQRDASAHSRMLYSLGETKSQIIEYFKKLKDMNVVEEVFPFCPQLNDKSKEMTREYSQDIIQRNKEWLEQRDQKIDQKKHIKELKKTQKELQSMIKPVTKNNKYAHANSKVKEYLNEKKYQQNNYYVQKTPISEREYGRTFGETDLSNLKHQIKDEIFK